MNKKLAVATISAATTLALTSNPVVGAVSCVAQYGGQYGQVCVSVDKLQVNKEVFNPNPKVNKFVDNITLDEATRHNFAPQDEVKFRITIKNTGDNTLTNIQVTDTLPSFLEQIAGEPYSFQIDTLKVGDSVQKELKAKVVNVDKLPSDKTVICDVNTSVAQSGNEVDRDTTQVCVEKKVARELPKAGAEGAAAILISSGLFGLIGNKLARVKRIGK
ncbi:MAG: hypothetical protein A2782_03080 [Candidatus Blackburnbacteria bacterium RIFCSPHIGHO2_01_FULL_43_15b]|uniref:DUF11 domain-containing protein n=1 Tax=Candidatus Blackburnbacteria bacterium RIFCSPHIGHO2_01_FULL_43_15b TaxID=1797513 RepID=A0A1G1V2Q2_9BACT|nr:MAG: hypothetical protein A2782_03080 [Candidatus Blackburnbacteria bacterium RIFCSPHIGHO2_01_FULL_43_15b]